LRNKGKFDTLKKFLPILSIILLTGFFTQGQSRVGPSQDVAERIIKYYPNPAVSSITFDFQKGFDKGYSIQVYNFLGKQIHESKNVSAKTTLDLATFNRGIYFYQLRDRTGKVIESGKFQVSK
jgi:type IX secretion system substrate protein